MTPYIDVALQEALEEVDAIGWAAPPVAPPRRISGSGQDAHIVLSFAEERYLRGLANAAGAPWNEFVSGYALRNAASHGHFVEVNIRINRLITSALLSGDRPAVEFWIGQANQR